MIKKRWESSQIGNLIPNHKSLKSKHQMKFDWGMLYTVRKNVFKAIRYFLRIIDKRLDLKKIWMSKVLRQYESQYSTWESWGKVTFGCNSHGKAQNILQGREWCLLPKVASHVKLVLEVVPTKSITPLPFNLHTPPSFLGCASWPRLEFSLVISS
jgi:hypothetical protein